MIESPVTPNRSWLLASAALAFVIISLFSIFFEVRQSSLSDYVDELQLKKETFSAPSQKTGTTTNTLAAALAVKSALKKIETDQLPWSKIVEKIEMSVPRLKDTNEPIILFRSYGGSDEGKISVSATTRSDSLDPFEDVALLIRAFAADPSFKRIFVPSVTKSLTPEGAAVLSFSINFEYQKPIF